MPKASLFLRPALIIVALLGAVLGLRGFSSAAESAPTIPPPALDEPADAERSISSRQLAARCRPIAGAEEGALRDAGDIWLVRGARPEANSRNEIGLPVEGRDQAVNTLRLENAGEFGAAGRHLADRAVDIDV